MRVNIEIEAMDNYKDSFWFEDITVATKGDYVLIPCGEVRVVTPEGQVYNQGQAMEYAEQNNWKDKDLEKFEFLMNNWFEVQKDTGEYFEETGLIAGDYDEGMELLKSVK